MLKYILLILLFFIVSCSSKKQIISITYNNEFSFKDEINKSIIDGFYNGDTTNIGNDIYLLK